MSFLQQIASVCSCECAVSEGVDLFPFWQDMFPQTGTKPDINQKVSCHVETVVLLSQHWDKSTCLDERGSRQIEMQASRLASLLAQKPDDTIEIDLDLNELDATSAEPKATYQEIKDYVLKEFGLKVSNLYISQIKRKCGIEVGENYNLPSRTKNPVCSAFVFIRGQRRSKLQFYSKWSFLSFGRLVFSVIVISCRFNYSIVWLKKYSNITL